MIQYFIISEEAIISNGAPTSKNAMEMEGQVFSKAKNKVSDGAGRQFS